jgi:hypothetical protein
MVREAQRAGLSFDDVKVRTLNCTYEEQEEALSAGGETRRDPNVPAIEIDPASPSPIADPLSSVHEHCTGGTNEADRKTASLTEQHDEKHHHHHLTSRFHKYVTPWYKVPEAEALPRWHFARHCQQALFSSVLPFLRAFH